MEKPPRRKPLDKERMFEGTRQKWMLIFLFCGGVVLFMSAKYGIDPAPFLTFITPLALLWLGGASGDSWIKAWNAGKVEQIKSSNGHSHVDNTGTTAWEASHGPGDQVVWGKSDCNREE